MAELDKFKRRLIRSVARKFLQKDRPEEELWEELNKETRSDCKVLWSRMRALTLRKLKRLVVAADKLDSIISVAQMTLSDWLLFDLMLVHEDIDVVGQDLRRVTDIGHLHEMYDLIEEFDVEGKQGEDRVSAWTQVTYNYNNRGRQCSPMLLQKRWYQMKKQVRLDFYNFWYSYRGNAKLLEKVKNMIPSAFEMTIAKRYPYIITKQFTEWSKLVEQKLVVLPEEFENKLRSQNLPKTVTNKGTDTENEPDLVLVEPNIETIEVPENDGDSDKEKSKEGSTETKPTQNVVIKSEPVDEIDLETQTDSEKLMEELSKRDTNLLNSIPDIDGDGDDIEIEEPTNVSTADACVEENLTSNIPDPSDTAIDTIPEPIMPQITNVFGNVVSESVLAQISNAASTVEPSNKEESAIEERTIEESTIEEITVEENEVLDKENPETEINTADYEADEKLKSFLETQRNDIEKPNVDDINQIENNKSTPTSYNVENSLLTNPFLGVPTDLTFAEDGIELVDDGIVFEDEEDIIKPYQPEDMPIGSTSKQSDIIEPKVETVEDESSKFDLKLLMLPTVLTTKLDHMMSLKNININEINGEQLINSIIVESKPKPITDKSGELTQKILDEKDFNSSHEDNDDSSDDSTKETDIISDEIRVKPTSYLLQKPRSRTYNPIQLCKNPDFNTRLKRLTVGFLSSTRNRAMLKTLKPMTIDVSKAFESRLIDGQTLYLKSHDAATPVEKVIEANEQVAVILPSAMPAQSLIDQVNAHVLSPPKTSNMTLHVENSIPQRNKIITLPDIENVRKMNQRLYTAEVTPIRAPGRNERVMPPVQLINRVEPFNTTQTNIITSKPTDKSLNHQVEINQSNSQKSDPKVTKNFNFVGKYGSRPNWTTASWFAKSLTIQNQNDAMAYNDSLLKLDSLNKMFLVINGKQSLASENFKKLSKDKKKIVAKDLKELQNNENKKEQTVNINDSTEIKSAVDSITQSKEDHKDKLVEPKNIINDESKNKTKIPKINLVPKFCCWARGKLANPFMRKRHRCPRRFCKCCCRFELADKIVWRKKAASYSSIVISDDEESPPNATEILNVKIRNYVDTQTQTPETIKRTEKRLSIQEEISILCDEAEKNFDKQNDSDVSEVTALDSSQTSDSTTNENSSEVSSFLPRQVDTAEKSRIMPRISVVPSSVLVAPTIKPIGHGNQYINLVPMSNTTKPIIKDTRPQNELVSINTYTSKDDGKKLKRTIYINPRGTGIFGKGAPIFLGRNKILLTDGIFSESSTLPKKNPEHSAPIIPNLVLPEGIQIVVLPDGQVSYVIDPAVQLDAEKMANLPHILLAVQQQLASAQSPAINQPVANIDLTNDMGPDLNEPGENILDNIIQETNTVNTNLLDEANVQTTDNTEAVTNTSVAVTDIGENLSESNKDKMPGVEEHDTYQNNAKESSSNITNDLNQSIEDKTINVSELENTPTKLLDHSYVFTGSPTSEKVSDSDVCNVNQNDNHSENVTNSFTNITNSTDDTTKSIPNKNSLLSDLMEMSGISMDDVTPTVTEHTSPVPLTTCEPRYLQTGVNVKPIITTSPKKSITELSSVSSFAQLKHACENKNKFFTLDLETGTVSSINVCLKLADKQRRLKPGTIDNSVIDLTSLEESEEYAFETLDPSEKKKKEPPNIIVLNKTIRSQDPRSLLKNDTPEAKPLKLFKSVAILNRKQRMIENYNDDKRTSTKLVKRYRKQSLDAIDNKDSVEESESSDDEPLASKAKRMRHAEKETPSSLENVQPNERITADSNNELDDKDTEMQTETSNALSQDNIEEEDMEEEIAFLCDGDESDDNGDCILGV